MEGLDGHAVESVRPLGSINNFHVHDAIHRRNDKRKPMFQHFGRSTHSLLGAKKRMFAPPFLFPPAHSNHQKAHLLVHFDI